MTLYRRKAKGNWWINIASAVPGAPRIRESTGTENKQLAEAYETKRKAEVWKEKQMGVKPDMLFCAMADMYLSDKAKARKESTKGGYELLLDWWKIQLKGVMLREIDESLIARIIKKKEVEVTGSTCNRYLSILRAVLRFAKRRYQLVERVPEFFKYDEPKARVRWLRPDEITRLLNALPEHLRDMAEFSLSTGLRQANVKFLRWDEVDLNNKVARISGLKMKNGGDFALPLNQAAINVLTRQIGKHHEAVFTYQGRPLRAISNQTWKTALEKAGIEDFRWHDMRHTWATMLVQSGVPDNALQVLGAWETPSMVRKYAHHSTESVRAYANLVDVAMSQNMTHEGETPKLRLVGNG
jgi:integrase